MFVWTDNISRQLGNLVEAEISEPEGEVEPTDHVVGIASEEVRRISTLASLFRRKAMEAEIEVRFSKDEIREQSSIKMRRFAENADVLAKIMWISIRDEFNLWDKPTIALRKGWQVVWSKSDIPSIGDILGGFFGK